MHLTDNGSILIGRARSNAPYRIICPVHNPTFPAARKARPPHIGPATANSKAMSHSLRNMVAGKHRTFRPPAKTDSHTVRSLDEVANILGLSRQRVHDIEKRAFKKLRRTFVKNAPALELERDGRGSIRGLKEIEHGSLA